jgi:hypothetical protein
MTAKLQANGEYDEYQKVLDDRLDEGIIETVDETDEEKHCYYLPHRAVFKPDSLTTLCGQYLTPRARRADHHL